MNGQDKIQVIAAKIESVYGQRMRMVEANTEALKCLNEVLGNGNGRTPSERFTDSLVSLQDSLNA